MRNISCVNDSSKEFTMVVRAERKVLLKKQKHDNFVKEEQI